MNCFVLRTFTILSTLRFGRGGFQGLSSTYEQTHVDERPFDPGIILTFHMGSFLQTGQYNKWLRLQLMLLYDNGRHG